MCTAPRSTRQVSASALLAQIEAQRARFTELSRRHLAVRDTFRSHDADTQALLLAARNLLAKQDSLVALARVSCGVDDLLELDDLHAARIARTDDALAALETAVVAHEAGEQLWGAYV